MIVYPDIDLDRCYEYKGWLMPLYYSQAGALFHICKPGAYNLAAISRGSRDGTFTANCFICKASMPEEYSTVFRAMWNLLTKV